jgi:hypothetical protein
LRAAVLPAANNDPIGVAGSDKMKQLAAPILALAAATDAVDLTGSTAITGQVSFWHKYQQQFHDLQQTTEESGSSSSMVDEPRPHDQPQKSSRFSTGSSMSINSSVNSPSSPPLDGSPPFTFRRW